MPLTSKIILFELNEIPWRVIDSYVAKHSSGALAQLVQFSKGLTTVCEDELELDPWIAWPTLHRGVTDSSHGILHLGQDLDEADRTYPPIWSLLSKAGVQVGVFGSLHSDPAQADLQNCCFFIPDTYADNAVVKPESLAALQQFNLLMTRKSARNVDTSIPVKEAIRFLTTYATNGMRLNTAALIGRQLMVERLYPHLRCRRRSLQPAMLFDVFMKLMGDFRPDFATFFTNHVAAAMHRYWAASFPNDVPGNAMSDEWTKKFESEIDNAMQILDRMANDLKNFVDANPAYKLVIVTAIGQAGVRARHASRFVTISDMSTFMDRLGMPREAWKEKHAMVPCKSVIVAPEYTDVLEQRLLRIKVGENSVIKSAKEQPPLSFDRRGDGSFHFFFYMEDYEGLPFVQFGNEVLPFGDVGLGFLTHQDEVSCTGRHTALGSMLVYDPLHPQAIRERPMVSTLEIAPAILDAFGITPPPYMRQPDPTLLNASIGSPIRTYEVTTRERQRQIERVD